VEFFNLFWNQQSETTNNVAEISERVSPVS